MYLLILIWWRYTCYGRRDLHPTMYLLILGSFTRPRVLENNLHPTMYLLIPDTASPSPATIIFTSHYVSINSTTVKAGETLDITFTSHYVSINSVSLELIIYGWLHLHPTMYLLIPIRLMYAYFDKIIYIPLCIY